MEDPWTRVISPEPNSNKVSLIFTNIHNVSYDGVQEIEATRIGAPDDAESVLESKFSQDYRPWKDSHLKDLHRAYGMDEDLQRDH